MSRKEMSGILPDAFAKNDYFRNRAPSRSPTRRPARKSQMADGDAKSFKWPNESQSQQPNHKNTITNGVAVNGTNGYRDRLPQINGVGGTNSATSDRSSDKSQNGEMTGEVTIAFIDYSENRNLIKRAKDQMRNVKIVQYIGQGKGSSRLNHEFWMQNETAAKFPVQQQSISSRTPLNFTFYLDGHFFHKISVCCLNKLRTTHQIIGSKTTHFKAVECTNVILCYRCKGHEFMLHSFNKKASAMPPAFPGRSVSMPRRGLNDTTTDTSDPSSEKRGVSRDRLTGDSASFGVKRSRSISRSRPSNGGRDNSRPAPLQRNTTKLLPGAGKSNLKNGLPNGHALSAFPRTPNEPLNSGREKLLENYCEDRLSPELGEDLAPLENTNGQTNGRTTGRDRKTSRSRKPSSVVRRPSTKEPSPPAPPAQSNMADVGLRVEYHGGKRDINDVGSKVEYHGGKRVGDDEDEVADEAKAGEEEAGSKGERKSPFVWPVNDSDKVQGKEGRTDTARKRQTSAASSVGSKTVSRPNSATAAEIPRVEETYQNELLSMGGVEGKKTRTQRAESVTDGNKDKEVPGKPTETFVRSESKDDTPKQTETMVRSADDEDGNKPTETFVRTETEPDTGETSPAPLQRTQPIHDHPDSSKANVDSAEDMIELAHDKPAPDAAPPKESVMPPDSIIHTNKQHPQSQKVHRDKEDKKPAVVAGNDVSVANVPSLAKEDAVAFAWPDSNQGNKATPSAPGTPSSKEESAEKPPGFNWPDAAEGGPGSGRGRSARPSRHVNVEILDERQNSQSGNGEEDDVPIKPVPLDEMALRKGITPAGTEIGMTTVRDDVPLDEIEMKRKRSTTDGGTGSGRGSGQSRGTPIRRMMSSNSRANSQDVPSEESRRASTPHNAEEFVEQLGYSRPSSAISEGRTTPATFEEHHTRNVPEGIYHDNPAPAHNVAARLAEKRFSDVSETGVGAAGRKERPKLNHIGASLDSPGSGGEPKEHIKPPSSPHTAAEMIDQLGFAEDKK